MPKFNVMENQLVPRHSLMTAKEGRELLERFEIDMSMLPMILDVDPCAKALGAKPGDVVKIERESPTAGTSCYYRLVVQDEVVP